MPDKIFYAIVILFVVLLPFAAIKSCQDNAKRHEWLEQHCKIIGRVAPSSNFGMAMTSKGVAPVTTFESGKTGYMCDDGLQYWE